MNATILLVLAFNFTKLVQFIVFLPQTVYLDSSKIVEFLKVAIIILNIVYNFMLFPAVRKLLIIENN